MNFNHGYSHVHIYTSKLTIELKINILVAILHGLLLRFVLVSTSALKTPQGTHGNTHLTQYHRNLHAQSAVYGAEAPPL